MSARPDNIDYAISHTESHVMTLFDPTLTPAEARRRLEQIPGAGLVLELEDVDALKALLADHERLRTVADQAREVRVRQRAYFKGRDDAALQSSKEAERRLDRLLSGDS